MEVEWDRGTQRGPMEVVAVATLPVAGQATAALEEDDKTGLAHAAQERVMHPAATEAHDMEHMLVE